MATNRKDVPQHYFSLEEYFALEKASDARFEYWDGDIVCMSGGSIAHARISGNVFYRLSQRLNGGPCQAFTAEMAIWTPTLPPYRYPDASVVCGEPTAKNIQGIEALINPVLIVEVLSPTTALHDRENKFVAYQAISTFSEYLLIAQDIPRVTHYRRQADSSWAREDVSDIAAALALDSVDCQLSLQEIYKNVKFD
jgi:Uma2 family endonuclease